MLLSGPLGRLFDVRESVFGALGASALVWAGVLVFRAWRGDLRASLRRVGLVNAAATLALAVLALLEDGLGARVLLAAVAVVVAVFGATQLVLLRRTR